MRHWKVGKTIVILDPQDDSSSALNVIRQKYGAQEIDYILMAARSIETKPPYYFKFIYSNSQFDRKKTMQDKLFAKWLDTCPGVEFVQYHVTNNSRKLKVRVHKEGDLMLLRFMK